MDGAIVLVVFIAIAAIVLGIVAQRTKKAFEAQNEVVPGRPTLAPGGWAGSHDPEALLHRRLRDAMSALRQNQLFDDDGTLLELRVELEQQAILLDERLVALAALPASIRDEPRTELTADVAMVEQAVADLVRTTTASARPALEATLARIRERIELYQAASASLDDQVLRLDSPGTSAGSLGIGPKPTTTPETAPSPPTPPLTLPGPAAPPDAPEAAEADQPPTSPPPTPPPAPPPTGDTA